VAVLDILTWNLKHGRAEPAAGHDLLPDFSGALAGWPWDIALLQEVPPWWPQPLAAATGATVRHVLTSRNLGLPVRRALARRRPDLMKSNGGGANAILVRAPATVTDHRERLLCRLPERRRVHAVRLEGGLWVGNLHATAHHAGAAQRDSATAAAVVTAWAVAAPCILGGDFNLRRLSLDGFTHAGGHDVDHVFVRGLEPVSVDVLDRGRLSDHAPVRATLTQKRVPLAS
jgi:endonuclease/exonuclease/phosphatase family metal-dependent hydrolase